MPLETETLLLMVSKIKLGVLGSGRGSNFLAIYNNILAGRLDAEVAVVISDKPSKMLEKAKEFGLENVYLNPKDFPSKLDFDLEIVKVLKAHQVELIVLAGYMRILSEQFINSFPNKIINIHPSLLPAFKGLHPQRQALEAGVKEAGCTVHFVTFELDSGPILLQEKVNVDEHDTEESLSAKILEKEHIIYTKAIRMVSGEK